MAWIKIPAEHHPIFRAALPKGASTKNMFGGVAAFVNDNMFGGLFARSIMVKLSPEDQRAALALDGAAPFDPMENGRIMTNTVMMPDSVMDDRDELRVWLQRGFDYVATLPPKQKKAKATSMAKAKTKPAAKAKAKAKPAAKTKSKLKSKPASKPNPKPASKGKAKAKPASRTKR